MRALLVAIVMFSLILIGNVALAHGDNTGVAADNHTAIEQAEGKLLWEKLQAKEITCADLSEEDFGALGEYFMGKMMGEQHEAMNTMMTQMMGEQGETQMHVAMGKRMSGCEPDAQMPQNMTSGGMMPMMQMVAPSGVEGMGGMIGNWRQNAVWQWTPLLLLALYIVWLAVGILAAIWLWLQITKK